jgi:hypothetical protein
MALDTKKYIGNFPAATFSKGSSSVVDEMTGKLRLKSPVALDVGGVRLVVRVHHRNVVDVCTGGGQFYAF